MSSSAFELGEFCALACCFAVPFLAAVVVILVAKRRRARKPSDRSKAIQLARDILAQPEKFAILDTETTGLGPDDEIIQIAILDPTGRILLNTLVMPTKRKRVPTAATVIHGIGFAELRGAPTWLELTPELERALSGRAVVSYNAAFDARLMKQTAAQNGGFSPSGSWHCAMLAYAGFVAEPDPRRPGEHKWHKLVGGNHSALGDCRATLDVIRRG